MHVEPPILTVGHSVTKDADAPMDAGATNVSVPIPPCPHAQLPEARLSQ